MARANPKFSWLGQYKIACNYELSGRFFHAVMDDGKEYALNFLDGENLQWAQMGEPFIWDAYSCLKGDDTTYLVHIRPRQYGGKINHAWIIDLAENLVTLVVMEEGVAPEIPRIISATPVFGALKIPGRKLSEKRHTFTDRLVGRQIKWRYSPAYVVQHIYHSEEFYRMPPYTYEVLKARYEDIKDSMTEDQYTQAMKRLERMKDEPGPGRFWEEPCFHIRISDNMELFVFFEENMLRDDPAHARGGNGVLLLIDIERLADVGLVFNTGKYEMLSAVGEPVEPVDVTDTLPSYSVKEQLVSVPSIFWEK